MASASVKSAVARIGSVNYSSLDELKSVKIPKSEQERVEEAVKTTETLPAPVLSMDALLKLFEAGKPLQCVRMPKREQRVVELHLDDYPY